MQRKPVEVKVNLHTREDGKLKNLDVKGLQEFFKNNRDNEGFKKRD
jgi:hypothetical protein